MKIMTRQCPVDSLFILLRPFFAPFMFQRFCTFLLFFSICSSTLVFAQNRPKLKQAGRDDFAGKLLLIPRDERPSSLLQPGMIAEVADHDLITPPVRLLGNYDRISGWFKTVDYHEIDGAIVSLDGLSGKGSGRGFIEFIKRLRSLRPDIPVYGFLTFSDQLNQIAQSAIGSVADGSLDFLSIGYEDGSGEGRHPALPANLRNEIDSRKLGEKVVLNDHADTVTANLLVRMINTRFGFTPRILPVYSSNTGRDAIMTRHSLPLRELVNERIKKSGGVEVTQTSDGARRVDVLLFIHTAQTRDQDRPAFVDAIAQTIDKNVRIALVDLSETKESRDAVINELKRRKLLDKLATYAAFDPANERVGEALTRAIAHSSSFLISIRFLRDDLERVRRFDRAHVGLLLSRYLTDWIFPFYVRPNIQASINDRPGGILPAPGQDPDAGETSAQKELRPFADKLFEEQFKRNIHGFLLSNGERTQFEVRLLQRLLVRLYSQPNSPQSAEIEVKPSIYLVHLGNSAVPQLRSQKLWSITTDGLDEYLGRRWDSVDWPSFKTDAESVEMVIKISSKSGPQLDSGEGYLIRSKGSRQKRRIEITALTNPGAFYALGKLEQMGANGQLAQDFEINEKPAIVQRGIIESFPSARWSHRDRIEMLRLLGRLRMNRYYYVPRDEIGRPEQMVSDGDKIKELVQVANENFIRFVYGVCLNRSILQSGDQGFALITSRLDSLSALGVHHFAICFENILEEKQTSLIARLREHLKRSGDSDLTVLPKFAGETETPCFSPQRGDWSTLDESALGFIARPASRFQSSKLMIATASEYAWSGPGYDPQRALMSAMNLLYDERSRAGLQVWSQFFGDCKNDRNPLVALLNQNNNRGLIEQKLDELRSALELIGGTRDRGLLRGELAQLIDRRQFVSEDSSAKKEEEKTKNF
jgi:hypothetical protein